MGIKGNIIAWGMVFIALNVPNPAVAHPIATPIKSRKKTKSAVPLCQLTVESQVTSEMKLSKTPNARQKKIQLNSKVKNKEDLIEVFEIIASSKQGKAVLEQFLPLYPDKIDINNMTKAMKERNGRAKNTAAKFVYDGNRREIFLDLQLDKGLVAVYLFHEMIHSLDKEYLECKEKNVKMLQILKQETAFARKASRREGISLDEIAKLASRMTAPERVKLRRLVELIKLQTQYFDICLFRAERKAWTQQHDFIAELSRNRCFRDFVQAHKSDGQIETRLPSSVSLMKAYTGKTSLPGVKLDKDFYWKYQLEKGYPKILLDRFRKLANTSQ